jgi:hypothetical protein
LNLGGVVQDENYIASHRNPGTKTTMVLTKEQSQTRFGFPSKSIYMHSANSITPDSSPSSYPPSHYAHTLSSRCLSRCPAANNTTHFGP